MAEYKGNPGYKIHLPVVDDINDPLTKRVMEYLNKELNITSYNFTEGHKVKNQDGCILYKIGSGGDFIDGKGITLYGKRRSLAEMQELAAGLEKEFGAEFAENIKKYGLRPSDPIQLTETIRCRFTPSSLKERNPLINPENYDDFLHGYGDYHPSGCPGMRIIKSPTGGFIDTQTPFKLSPLEHKYWVGETTKYHLENFGELFTGKIEGSKIPKFVMDGLPKEYLEAYHLTEKDILASINKGTKNYISNMLKKLSEAGAGHKWFKSGHYDWLKELDPKIINETVEMLAQNEPQVIRKLEQILPQLEKTCPSLSVLRQTTTSSSLVPTPTHKIVNSSAVSEMRAEWETPKTSKPQVTTSQPAKNLSSKEVVTNIRTEWNSVPKAKPATSVTSKSVSWVDDVVAKFNPKRSKVGLCITGAIALTGVAASIFSQSNSNELLATNKPNKQLNTYSNCFSLSKGNMTI